MMLQYTLIMLNIQSNDATIYTLMNATIYLYQYTLNTWWDNIHSNDATIYTHYTTLQYSLMMLQYTL